MGLMGVNMDTYATDQCALMHHIEGRPDSQERDSHETDSHGRDNQKLLFALDSLNAALGVVAMALDSLRRELEPEALGRSVAGRNASSKISEAGIPD